MEQSVRASWHKEKETKPSLWQPFSRHRQRYFNRGNSRVYRLRYGSKSELQDDHDHEKHKLDRDLYMRLSQQLSLMLGRSPCYSLCVEVLRLHWLGCFIWARVWICVCICIRIIDCFNHSINWLCYLVRSCFEGNNEEFICSQCEECIVT